MATEKLTEYERKRLENIRRNDEMIASLKIHAKASLLSSATKRQRVECKSYNSSERKKNKPETPIVIRRSLRARGLKPDSAGLSDDFLEYPKSVISPKQSPRVMAPLAFKDAYDGSGSDRQFVDTIMDIAKRNDFGQIGLSKACKDEESGDVSPVSNEVRRCTRSSGRRSGVVKSEDSTSSGDSVKEILDFPASHENSVSECVLDLGSMALEPDNIARVVPGRILVVKFMPSANINMVAAGDKLGNIGFWNMDSNNEEEDGIYLYRPHTGPVSSILFQQSSLSKVISSCYDGFIRSMDAEKTVFDLVYSSDYAIYSLSQRPDDGNSLYFGEGSGGFNLWDLRAGKSSYQWDLHENRINSVDFNPQNPYIMATSSTDGTACLWDLRSMGAEKPKTLNTVNHARAVHSAYFSPSGLSLATTSLDDHVGILGGSNYEDVSMIYHYNQTGRWISSFRGIWGWDDSYIFIGNMVRGVDVISPKEKRRVMALESPHVSAISCRFHSHPLKVGMLAGSTAGGQVYVWTRH